MAGWSELHVSGSGGDAVVFEHSFLQFGVSRNSHRSGVGAGGESAVRHGAALGEHISGLRTTAVWRRTERLLRVSSGRQYVSERCVFWHVPALAEPKRERGLPEN